MSNTIQKYILSSAITFAATFLTILGGQLATLGHTDPNTVTANLIVSALVVAARAAVKAVIESVPTFGRIAKK